MNEFRYVPQRGLTDCGTAAVAMFMGVTYEQAVDAIRSTCPEWTEGTPISLSILLGTLAVYDDLPVMSHFVAVDRPAIVCVFSPGDPTQGHAVYWDGESIHDPCTGMKVTQEWMDKHCYAQIQRIRDVARVLGSRSRAAVLDVLECRMEVNFLVPGERRAA